MKAEEISMIKAQTFSATPTPADGVTPMALTMANIIRNDTLTTWAATVAMATPAALSCLTDREREICVLIAARLTNREIGQKLYLSEGSVKQYSNQIYSKLHIEGDTRTKRKRLIDLLESNNF